MRTTRSSRGTPANGSNALIQLHYETVVYRPVGWSCSVLEWNTRYYRVMRSQFGCEIETAEWKLSFLFLHSPSHEPLKFSQYGTIIGDREVFSASRLICGYWSTVADNVTVGVKNKAITNKICLSISCTSRYSSSSFGFEEIKSLMLTRIVNEYIKQVNACRYQNGMDNLTKYLRF